MEQIEYISATFRAVRRHAQSSESAISFASTPCAFVHDSIAIREECFAAGVGEVDDGAGGCEVALALGGMVGEQEDAVGAGPKAGEVGVGEEDVWGVRPEASEPGAVDAAVDEERGLACVEEQRGAGGELAVDEDEVA